MASISELEQLKAPAELRIPRPVIISLGMTLPDWKEYFAGKSSEATSSIEKRFYDRCLKTLMFAEFCGASLSYVGNAKDTEGILTVKFIFQFPDINCKCLFQNTWTDNVEIVTQH